MLSSSSTITLRPTPEPMMQIQRSFLSFLSLCCILACTNAFQVPARGVTTATPTTNANAAMFPLRMSQEASEDNFPQIPYLTKSVLSDRSKDLMLGEDAAIFDVKNEEWGAFGAVGWLTFSAAVGTILTAVAVLWVYPATGYGDDFMHFLETDVAGGNSHITTLLFGLIFPVVHSGLASLRKYGEPIVGARTWRVIFAFPSLCLSYSWITYFISHAHDGMVFYDLSHNGIAHGLAWCVNFLSFFFLYPTVFNLKEVAAIEIPKVHLWETGIIRITRHPQFVGQVMWSAAHLTMVGSTFTALTMALLVGHHYFACWNGDRRLEDEHGENFLKIKERTSVIPFKAIIEGRQVLPPDYYKELLRAPYALIAVGTLGAYFAHPYMQAGAALAKNSGLTEGGILNGILP